MARSREMTLSLPPFTRAVTWLLAINTAVFLMLELFGMTLIDVARWVRDNLALVPQDVVHGSLWQLVTYSFLHFEFWHWFGNMLGIWMFGSAFEGSWGTRRFIELYSFGVIGAALTTTVLSYSHVLGNPTIPTVGASGGVFAILIAFGIVFGENEILMIPFPISLKAKYFRCDSYRGDPGIRDSGWRERCVRRPPGRLVLWIHLREVRAPQPYAEDGPVRTLFRIA